MTGLGRERVEATVRCAREPDVLLTHRLDTDGESDFDLTGPDLVRDHGHGHESTRAKAVDHFDWNVLREASSERSTTGVVDRIGCQNGADTDITHASGVDVGVNDSLLWWFKTCLTSADMQGRCMRNGLALNISSMSSSVLYEVEIEFIMRVGMELLA